MLLLAALLTVIMCKPNEIITKETKRVVDLNKFIMNNAADHDVMLPGRVPGFSRDGIKLLPSSYTKKVVYCKYRESLKDTLQGRR